MRHIVRLGLVIALLASLLGPISTLAQEGTPTTAVPSGVGPAVGSAVPYYGQDGVQIGTITVDEIVEPFEDYDEFSTPQRGYHFTLITVSISNTGTRPFEVSPSSFVVIDDEGFIASSAFVGRGTDPAIPDLEFMEALAPGDSVTGALGFEIFNESAVGQVIFRPVFDRLIPVADLRPAPAVAGEQVPVIGVDGNEMVQVTINAITDPFEDFDPSNAPPRGSRYLMLDVTIVNTSQRVVQAAPSDFILVDDQGFVVQETYISRSDQAVPDLPFQALDPGQEIRGVIGYQLLSGVPVVQILYGDQYERLVVLADLSQGTTPQTAGGALPEPDDSGSPEPTEVPDSGALEPTEEPIDQPTLGASSPACEGLVEWGIDLVTRLSEASAAVQPLRNDVGLLDPVMVRGIADQLTAMGEEQANSDPPPAAEALNTLMTEQFFQALASATNRLADALEMGNTVTALLAQTEAEAVQEVFTEGGEADTLLIALEEECPQETQSLNEG